ncbi:hypothetical protein [Devosia pacifica]|nr:hypothetical protein [Devosia pacifica]
MIKTSSSANEVHFPQPANEMGFAPLERDCPPHMDPAAMVALGIRFGIMGRVSRQGVPAPVREGLRHHARNGEPACALVLDWLDGLLLSDLEAVARASGPRQ